LLLMLGCVFIIGAGLISLFLLVCTAVLIRNLLNSSYDKLFILRLGLISVFLFLMLWMNTVWFFFNMFAWPRWKPELLAWYACLWFPSFLAPLTLAFSFRVAVQKEIELSKSATSSTSSSSSKSSSSSSSANDPVIEL
jgi:hypothetical protein